MKRVKTSTSPDKKKKLGDSFNTHNDMFSLSSRFIGWHSLESCNDTPRTQGDIGRGRQENTHAKMQRLVLSGRYAERGREREGKKNKKQTKEIISQLISNIYIYNTLPIRINKIAGMPIPTIC